MRNRIEYIKYRKQQCEECGVLHNRRYPLTIHHKDNNHENNDVNNLKTLCNDCHYKTHYGDEEERKLKLLKKEERRKNFQNKIHINPSWKPSFSK